MLLLIMVVVVVVVVWLPLELTTTIICLPLATFGCTICTGLLLGFCDSGSNLGIGFTTLAFFKLANSAAVGVVFGFRTGFFLATAPVLGAVVAPAPVAALAGSNLALLWSMMGATLATCLVTVVVLVEVLLLVVNVVVVVVLMGRPKPSPCPLLMGCIGCTICCCGGCGRKAIGNVAVIVCGCCCCCCCNWDCGKGFTSLKCNCPSCKHCANCWALMPAGAISNRSVGPIDAAVCPALIAVI